MLSFVLDNVLETPVKVVLLSVVVLSFEWVVEKAIVVMFDGGDREEDKGKDEEGEEEEKYCEGDDVAFLIVLMFPGRTRGGTIIGSRGWVPLLSGLVADE